MPTETTAREPGTPEAGADERVVDLVDVTRRFDGEGGVEDVTLHVPRGTVVGLVGPSGSGKTTTVRLLLGVDRPESGQVRVLGDDPTDFGRRDRTRLGYLPQETVLYEDLSLRHNLQLMASLYGMPWRGALVPRGRRGKAARRRVEDLIEMLDLGDAQHNRLRDASGGEQKRLGLACALVHEPELLVLDEPTSGLDPVLRQRLWEHLENLRGAGVSLLVTTQYINEAEHCDLLAMLVDGRVLALDAPDALRRRTHGPEAGADVPFDDVFVRLVEEHRGSPSEVMTPHSARVDDEGDR